MSVDRTLTGYKPPRGSKSHPRTETQRHCYSPRHRALSRAFRGTDLAESAPPSWPSGTCWPFSHFLILPKFKSRKQRARHCRLSFRDSTGTGFWPSLAKRRCSWERLGQGRGGGWGAGEAKVFLPPFLLRRLCRKWLPLLLDAGSHRAGRQACAGSLGPWALGCGRPSTLSLYPGPRWGRGLWEPSSV